MEEMLNDHGAGSSDDLKGLDILLVEDLWAVGDALKQLLELLGASVSGPAATTAEAERLLAQRLPDVALVDVHLRGGEQSDLLVKRLTEQGVAVIMLKCLDRQRSFLCYRQRAQRSWRNPSAKQRFSRTCAL